MWALELLRDHLRSPDVDERSRRHRHQDGVRQLTRELRDRDADAQPLNKTKKRARENQGNKKAAGKEVSLQSREAKTTMLLIHAFDEPCMNVRQQTLARFRALRSKRTENYPTAEPNRTEPNRTESSRNRE